MPNNCKTRQETLVCKAAVSALLSYIQSGYIVVKEYDAAEKYMYWLRHKSNGNCIKIEKSDVQLRVFLNNKLVKSL